MVLTLLLLPLLLLLLNLKLSKQVLLALPLRLQALLPLRRHNPASQLSSLQNNCNSLKNFEAVFHVRGEQLFLF